MLSVQLYLFTGTDHIVCAPSRGRDPCWLWQSSEQPSAPSSDSRWIQNMKKTRLCRAGQGKKKIVSDGRCLFPCLTVQDTDLDKGHHNMPGFVIDRLVFGRVLLSHPAHCYTLVTCIKFQKY